MWTEACTKSYSALFLAQLFTFFKVSQFSLDNASPLTSLPNVRNADGRDHERAPAPQYGASGRSHVLVPLSSL